jgi:hypothetical protein
MRFLSRFLFPFSLTISPRFVRSGTTSPTNRTSPVTPVPLAEDEEDNAEADEADEEEHALTQSLSVFWQSTALPLSSPPEVRVRLRLEKSPRGSLEYSNCRACDDFFWVS